MFSLYHNKQNKELIIEPIKRLKIDKSILTDKVTTFNDYYYVSLNRKALKDKANELKESWIKETERELNGFRELKIKNKY